MAGVDRTAVFSDLDFAAQRYEEAIRRVVPGGAQGVPAFDLVWLGMGDDGHTASLFPGTEALEERERLVVENEIPRLRTRRMTFTLPLINSALRVQFIVTGDKKASMLDKVVRGGDEEAAALPAARVQPVGDSLEWVVDRNAASGMAEPDLLADA